MAKRATDYERLIVMLQTRSQRQVAREIGVHHKTIQRWIKHETTITKNRDAVVRISADDRRKTAAKAKREGYRPAPTTVPVQSERTRRVDPYDPSRTIPSDAVDYDTPFTSGKDAEAIDKVFESTTEDIINHYRDKAQYMGMPAQVRFLIQGEPSPDYPRGIKWTIPYSITGKRTAKQLIALALKDAGAFGVILQTRVTDPVLEK